MEGRIMHIESVLENCEIIEESSGDVDAVTPGVTVSILYEGDDTPELLLVGSIEEKREDIDVVSPGSPLGEALLGGKIGDTVSFEAPHGILKVKIVSIEN